MTRDNHTDVIPLAKLNPGECGTIWRLTSGTSSLRQRLLEIGLVNGALVKVVRFAPLGDPMELEIHGCRLSLRRREAQTILIRKEAS